jgi:hypothetical protein
MTGKWPAARVIVANGFSTIVTEGAAGLKEGVYEGSELSSQWPSLVVQWLHLGEGEIWIRPDGEFSIVDHEAGIDQGRMVELCQKVVTELPAQENISILFLILQASVTELGRKVDNVIADDNTANLVLPRLYREHSGLSPNITSSRGPDMSDHIVYKNLQLGTAHTRWARRGNWRSKIIGSTDEPINWLKAPSDTLRGSS